MPRRGDDRSRWQTERRSRSSRSSKATRSSRVTGAVASAPHVSCERTARSAAELVAITTASRVGASSRRPSTRTSPGFKLGRTPQLHMTYLMWKEGVGFRVGTSRTYTNGHGQSLAGPGAANERRACRRRLGRQRPRERGGGTRSRDVAVAALPAPDRAFRRSTGRPGEARAQPGRRSGAPRPALPRARHRAARTASCSRTRVSASSIRTSVAATTTVRRADEAGG